MTKNLLRMPATVKFTSLIECDAEDLNLMTEQYVNITNAEALTERAIGMLTNQKGIFGGGQVDLYEHGLQTATRCVKLLLKLLFHSKKNVPLNNFFNKFNNFFSFFCVEKVLLSIQTT